MTELRPCPGCRRHVRIAAASCPFCAASLPPARGQFSRPLAFTRAAIFSAAIAGCSDHERPPAPAPTPSGSAMPGSGSDDLEKMLDNNGGTVQHASPIDAAIDAPVDARAVAIDAAVAPDAGVIHKKRRIVPPPPPPPPPPDLEWQRQNIPKPYGAPPARRRLV